MYLGHQIQSVTEVDFDMNEHTGEHTKGGVICPFVVTLGKNADCVRFLHTLFSVKVPENDRS